MRKRDIEEDRFKEVCIEKAKEEYPDVELHPNQWYNGRDAEAWSSDIAHNCGIAHRDYMESPPQDFGAGYELAIIDGDSYDKDIDASFQGVVKVMMKKFAEFGIVVRDGTEPRIYITRQPT